MTIDAPSSHGSRSAESERRAYAAPRLGQGKSVRELTQTSSQGSISDAGGGTNNMQKKP
jgi:hypothetical protein